MRDATQTDEADRRDDGDGDGGAGDGAGDDERADWTTSL